MPHKLMGPDPNNSALDAAAEHNPARRDHGLIQLLASGRAAWEQLFTDAASLPPTRRSHLTRIARLKFLAPDIVVAILEGQQPVALTSRALLRIAALPVEGNAQRKVLGFA
jgi:site-specific DNA recombinase